jgi:uncharacterized protein (TIGR01777 family)
MRIGITGASGMIGQRLSALAMSSGHEIISYSRRSSAQVPLITKSLVSTATNVLPETKLDALVHLAGENLFGLWTTKKRKSIWHSRVDLTKQIVTQLKTWTAENRPRVLLCASGIGFYGSRGDTILEENSSQGSGFLADLCRDWEAAAREAATLGIRIVHLRTGVVLGENGGAFPKMRTAFKLAAGGRFGSGKQWMSWIHEQDQAALMLWALENEAVVGPLNLCSPQPVTNADFTRLLAAHLHRPAFIHVPAFALRLLMPGMADEMLLGSQRAFPRAATDLGYKFAYPNLSDAFVALS